MTQITPGIEARIDLLKPLIAELLAERGITALTKTHNYLPVFLGLRQLALTYLPAELPGGPRMGAAIDQYYQEHYTPGMGVKVNLLDRLRKRGVNQEQEAELLARRRVLDQAYDEIVAASPAYVAHLNWLDRLAMHQVQVKRRPSLREMYIYREKAVRDQLLRLEEVGENARRKMAESRRGRLDQWVEYVYANEFDVEYVRGLGALLGYPQCCVERYAADRSNGVNVEQRAWEQVRDLQAEAVSVDVRAYYVKDFFPCTPDCPAAIAQGELHEAVFALLDPEVHDLYVGAMYSSFELVQNYPTVIQQHKQRLEQGPPA